MMAILILSGVSPDFLVVVVLCFFSFFSPFARSCVWVLFV